MVAVKTADMSAVGSALVNGPPAHYLGLFTVASWREFNIHGATVMGFTEAQARAASRLHVGDRILAYLSKVSAFVAVLEVTGQAYADSAPIWTDGVFPVRVPVRIVVEVPLSIAIPIRALVGSLTFLPAGQAPSAWTVHVRSAPRRWKDADGEAVTRALMVRRDAVVAGGDGDASSPVVAGRKAARRGVLPVTARVGRIVARTERLFEVEPETTVGSYDTVLSGNKVTGYSVNVPIAMTCRPSLVCLDTCYFAAGAPTWVHALRHQRRVYDTIVADPRAFAERVALEYDNLGLTFLRWNGGGDLFAESVEAINHLGRMRPDIPVWVVTRLAEWASQIDELPNVFVHFSLDRHSLPRRAEFLGLRPRTRKFFFSYQCAEGEVPDPETIATAGVSVLFFNNYDPPEDIPDYDGGVLCPLNSRSDISGTCSQCRRCFDGSAVAHGASAV